MNKYLALTILIYFLTVSFLTVILTIHDKSAAKKNRSRVPERTLILFALFGGAIAELITMKIIHHKTLHKKFMWGLPAIIVLHVAAVILIALKAYNVI